MHWMSMKEGNDLYRKRTRRVLLWSSAWALFKFFHRGSRLVSANPFWLTTVSKPPQHLIPLIEFRGKPTGKFLSRCLRPPSAMLLLPAMLLPPILGHAAAAADIRRERQNIEQKAPDSLWIEIMVEMVFGKEVQIWLGKLRKCKFIDAT